MVLIQQIYKNTINFVYSTHCFYMRKRIFEMIEPGTGGSAIARIYDIVMLLAITVSIIPLMFYESHPLFGLIEIITVILFIIDYLLRWFTADYRISKGPWSFFLYPFTGWAILDMLSILPAFTFLSRGFKLLRLSRLARILRIFKFVRYSDNFRVLGKVMRKERGILLTVLGIAVFYVFLTAMIMFNAEPHINPTTGDVTFRNFFDALYWATVTLTTVGYGDMVPVTEIGRFVSMLSSLFGVAIIALPSGVITASYLEELREAKKNDKPNVDLS